MGSIRGLTALKSISWNSSVSLTEPPNPPSPPLYNTSISPNSLIQLWSALTSSLASLSGQSQKVIDLSFLTVELTSERFELTFPSNDSDIPEWILAIIGVPAFLTSTSASNCSGAFSLSLSNPKIIENLFGFEKISSLVILRASYL